MLSYLCFLRITVCYVSDHWAQYVSVAGGSSSHGHTLSLDKLQVEYDNLFLRAVLHVLRNKRWEINLCFDFNSISFLLNWHLYSAVLLHRLGIWLFMSEMPYGTLSSSMLWRVLYVMQCAETAGLETLGTANDTHSCIQALRGTSIHS